MEQGKGMSFAEFSYPLMQAWDWWHMWNTLDVQMQIGGSDQYGNIVTGVDAVKVIRDSEGQESDKKPAETPLDDPIGFTVPLLTDGSGAKFGKSAGNAIWLDPIQTSPFDLYAYLIGRPDDDVERLLKLFTFIPLPEIREIMTKQNQEPSKRIAHHHLAYEVTRLVHGREVAAVTQHEHRAMFGGDVDTIPPGDTKFISLGEKGTRNKEDGEYAAVEGHPTVPNNAPRVDMQLPESLIMGMSIARILYAAGLATSTSDAQRVVVRKGAYVGGAPGQKARENKGMSEHQLQFTPVTAWFPEDTRRFLIDGKILILRKGKHNLRVIEMVSDEEWKNSKRTYPGEPFTGAVRQMKQKLKEAKEALRAKKEDAAAAIAEEKDAAESEAVDDGQELVFPPKVSERMRGLRTQYDDLKSRLAAKRQSLSQGKARGEAPWMKRGSPRVTRLRESLSRPGDRRYGR
jgi:tyrosyl-tRNA synthetase